MLLDQLKVKIMIKPISSEQNRPIIVFGEDWQAHPSSTQHIIKILAQNRSIIWFNSIGLRKPKLTGHDLFRLYNKVKKFIFNQNTEHIENNYKNDFLIINPLVIPCANSWLSLKVSKYILKYQLLRAYKKLAIKNPIIWASLPTTVDYLKVFDNAPCVYYCGDDFSCLAGVDHEFVSKKERELVKESKYLSEPSSEDKD